MRKKIHDIVNANVDSTVVTAYDVFMVVLVGVSLIPLCFHEHYPVFVVIDYICVVFFIADYIARWVTADYKLGKGALSFVLYPFTPMALVDLVSIIPFFANLNPALRALRVTRLLQALRAFRLVRYSKGLSLIVGAVKRQRVPLLFVCLFVAAYVLISAMVMFNAEPNRFPTYLEAVYWSVVTVATVGYGDYTPITDAGRIIAIVSALVGILVVALPASVITAGFMEETRERREAEEKEESSKESPGA